MFTSKHHAWQLAGIALLALVLLALSLSSVNNVAATQPAAPAADEGNMTSKGVVQVAAARPWTREEMLAAKPYPMPRVSGPTTTTWVKTPDVSGAPGTVPGGLPGGQALNQLPVDQLLAMAAPRAVNGYAYPAPHTSYEVFTSYQAFPYRAIGKLFFTQNGNNYVCSASSIGNFAIWTAGHCVHDGSNLSTGWSSNIVFVPAYKDGNAPYGQWAGSWSATKTVWYANGNPNGLRRDMGAVVLRKLAGVKISQKVGWLGFAWNWSYTQHWNLFGYPVGISGGNRLETTEASYAYSLGYGTNGPLTQGVGSNLTGGSSGGPWILQFGTGNYVNGENSYCETVHCGTEMNSPHYDNQAKSLLDLIVAGVP